MKRFVYYQPNNKDIEDTVGDCQIRAISKALNKTWVETFDIIMPICREMQTMTIITSPHEKARDGMAKLGFNYVGISNKKGSVRPTVASFAKDHPKGTYVVRVSHHVVAVVDGKYYDTWDSGYKSLYGYYEKTN